jgi:glycosyltransferase involved in cell wall biosynthesis
MPLHNKGRYVVRAVESVLRQTHQDFTLTVVDDGSTDDSATLVARIADPRIVLIRTACRGPGAARNTGIRATDTEWVALLDADDEWEPDFLRRTCAVAQQEPDLVAVFTHVAARGADYVNSRRAEGRIDDYHAARMSSWVAITSSSVLLRRSVMLAIGGFREDYAYAEDTEAWFRLTCAGPTYFIPARLATLETGDPGGITRATDESQKVAGLQHLLDSYAAHDAAGRIPADQARSCRRFMEHQRGRVAVHLARGGRPLTAARLLISSVPLGFHTWREYRECVSRALKSGW